MQLDVTSSQLLVTDSVFRDEGFRKQLSETVKALLKLRVIPIFNENDAVSTRKAPYEVCNSTCSYTLSVEFVLICNLFALFYMKLQQFHSQSCTNFDWEVLLALFKHGIAAPFMSA